MPASFYPKFLDLLHSVLHTFQQAACDGETIRMECPANTFIHVNSWHYGPLNRTLITKASNVNVSNGTIGQQYVCADRTSSTHESNNISLLQTDDGAESITCSEEAIQLLKVIYKTVTNNPLLHLYLSSLTRA